MRRLLIADVDRDIASGGKEALDPLGENRYLCRCGSSVLERVRPPRA